MSTPPRFKALSLLENECVPVRNRREPYWRPQPAPCFRDAHTPTWDWTHPAYSTELGMALTSLDRNAAYLSAVTSADFAHGKLERTGALPYGSKQPGYYKIDYHDWQDPRIPSPLGDVDHFVISSGSGKLWVTHPTIEQLTQICESGHWPDVRIHDSWTCDTPVRLRDWGTAVNNHRIDALRDVHADADHDPAKPPGKCPCPSCVRYKAVKDGFYSAVQMFLGKSADGSVKSGVKRPDWYHTVHAQHAATTWRYVWHALLAGYEPVGMFGTDEVVYPTAAIPELRAGEHLKIDDTGERLGAFKVKEVIPAAAAHG